MRRAGNGYGYEKDYGNGLGDCEGKDRGGGRS